MQKTNDGTRSCTSIVEPGAVICVTGASGYIASVLVAELKAAGYKVIGTVRDVDKYRRERVFDDVDLYCANLLDKKSFSAPFAKCDAVIHTASPFWFPNATHDAMEDFVRPALEGTRNVLESAYAAGIRNVVITSSTGAITPQVPADFPGDEPGWTREFTEEDWSLDSTMELQPYRYSKRVAEKAAWEFAEAHPDLHLAIVNPSGTLGPLVMDRADGECVQLMKKILEGGDDGVVSNQTIGWVDVRDVALAHIRAMQPNARGQRFIISLSRAATYLDIAEILKEEGDEFAAFPLPTSLKSPVSIYVKYSNARAREILGLEFRPLRVAVLDMARDLVKRGIVRAPKKRDFCQALLS
eukprot:TRINITY_DN62433_c0_g1_i1.p1 TRINITY_DN62433_c0_g1~~TRINITY_DN62433_c0_g1_i1.p1  ORF type:complete len:355 (+),score=61.75 TRINITY_DN62433_c0_g1_i1:54-1118(+)